MKCIGRGWIAILFLLEAGSLQAQTPQQGIGSGSHSFESDALFEKGQMEAAINNGVLFSPFIARSERPTVNYTISELQFGYMLGKGQETGLLRGNFELVGDVFGGSVFDGHGVYVAGLTGWLRYNLVPAHCRLVPFAQAGAGLTYTDINHFIIGQRFNFNLNLGVGARYFVTGSVSVNLEYRYQHISNANMSHRNLGINSQGPMLGFSFFF